MYPYNDTVKYPFALKTKLQKAFLNDVTIMHIIMRVSATASREYRELPFS